MKRIQIAVSDFGARVFRNQVGTYQAPDGSWQKCGLMIGSSDLIGWHKLKVTQEMVGTTLAVFTSIEVKTPKGRLTKSQGHWLREVKQQGGIAIVATDEREAVRQLDAFTRGSTDA